MRGASARVAVIRVQAEQRPHGDSHRQLARPVVDVDAAADLPGGEPPLGLGGHRVERGRDRVAVKRGQHDLARAAVIGAVDRQQAVAEQRRELPEIALAPMEVGRVRDEHVVVGGRAEHEHDPLVEDPHAEDGPEAVVAVEQDRKRIGDEPHRARHVETREASRPAAAGAELVAQVGPEPDERVVRNLGRAGGLGRRRHACCL